jgi:hypothetical protein
MPNSFFVNDYKILQDHIPLLPRPRSFHLASRVVDRLVPEANGSDVAKAPAPTSVDSSVKLLPVGTVVLASFSNYQKLDPFVVDIWSNTLRRLPQAMFWVLRHHADEVRILCCKPPLPNTLGEFRVACVPLAWCFSLRNRTC